MLTAVSLLIPGENEKLLAPGLARGVYDRQKFEQNVKREVISVIKQDVIFL